MSRAPGAPSNVLFVATRGHGDAVDPFLARLGAGLAARGHRVGQVSGDGVVALAGNVRRALARGTIDILHADSAAAALAAWMGRGDRAVPIVGSARPSSGRFPLGTARILNATCDAVVATSGHLADALVASGLDGAKVSTIYDGIPPDELGLIAAAVEARGVARADSGTPAQERAILTMAPDPRDPGDRLLAEAIGRLGPALQVRLLVASEDGRGWAPLLAASDVFCLPLARADGPPLSVQRAMAAGLPVVATAVGCMSEVVSHGGNGFLVHPRDSQGLANALARLLSDPDLARRMGRFGRDTSLVAFSTDAMLRGFEALYAQVDLSGRGVQEAAECRVLLSGQPFDPLSTRGRGINEKTSA